MHYSSKKVLQFPCKKCIIILVRNKYTTQRYIVKENKDMTVSTNIGKITASKEVLNMLSLSLSESAAGLADRGYYARSKQDQTTADEIYSALDAVGFYRH